jgi:predicted lipoprotein with Yx(FWY)xxD motif
MKRLAAVAAAAAALGAGLVGPDAAMAGEPKGKKIAVAGSQYGKILFDTRGQAIYLFDRERTSKPRCYGACAKAWPPVYTKAKPRAGRGIDPKLLGTSKRKDGRRQVTYDGHPLYFYAHEGPDEVLCHDVQEFGGL